MINVRHSGAHIYPLKPFHPFSVFAKSNCIVGLIRKGGVKRREEPSRIRSAPENKVILQRVNRIRVIPRNRSGVFSLAALHVRRHPPLSLIYMTVVELSVIGERIQRKRKRLPWTEARRRRMNTMH